jgi:hypothetical protein
MSGFGSSPFRPAPQVKAAGSLVSLHPEPSLAHVRVDDTACARFRSGPTQVFTIITCPGAMSPPVAAASARTPTSLIHVSLSATVSTAVVAVPARFVDATSRTWFAPSPSRHADTFASTGMLTAASGV